jgi:hypothetical protein
MVPLGSEVNVRLRAAGLMTMVMGPLPVLGGLPESTTLTVTGVLPEEVGVPTMVQPLRERPAGSVPAVMVQV